MVKQKVITLMYQGLCHFFIFAGPSGGGPSTGVNKVAQFSCVKSIFLVSDFPSLRGGQ